MKTRRCGKFPHCKRTLICYNHNNMAKPKQSIMDMTPQELLKMFVASVGELIDARNETLKTTLMAEMKAVRNEMTTKDDIKRLEQKIDKKVADHEKRIEQLEEDQLSTHKN